MRSAVRLSCASNVWPEKAVRSSRSLFIRNAIIRRRSSGSNDEADLSYILDLLRERLKCSISVANG